MVETQETSVFTGDCEGNRAKLPKKRGSVMAPPSPKPIPLNPKPRNPETPKPLTPKPQAPKPMPTQSAFASREGYEIYGNLHMGRPELCGLWSIPYYGYKDVYHQPYARVVL